MERWQRRSFSRLIPTSGSYLLRCLHSCSPLPPLRQQRAHDGPLQGGITHYDRGFGVSKMCTQSGNREQTSSNSIRHRLTGSNTTSLGIVKKAALVFGAATIASYFLYHANERQPPIKATNEKKVVVTRPFFGGPFILTNHEGRRVEDKDFVGHWNLIYFGYTFCPDICPEELQKMSEAVDKLESMTGEQVSPVFITIDPKRDSVKHIRAYIKEFHPRFVGLTGTTDDLRQVAREYRVYYKKTDEEGSDYLLEYSNVIYLMDPNMKPVKIFGKDYATDDLVAAVAQEINCRKP